MKFTFTSLRALLMRKLYTPAWFFEHCVTIEVLAESFENDGYILNYSSGNEEQGSNKEREEEVKLFRCMLTV